MKRYIIALSLIFLFAATADARMRVWGGKDSFAKANAGGHMVTFLTNPANRLVEAHSTSREAVTVQAGVPITIGTATYVVTADTDVTLADLDTGVTSEGTDYYVYAVNNNGLDFRVSANSTWPNGFSADTSTKIGGFHLLCASVDTIDERTIVEHDLSGYMIGDILPASIWDLRHRPVCSPRGMVYSEGANIWVDIYLASGTGDYTASKFGRTISDTRNWMDFVDDFATVGKQLLDDSEFRVIAAGSNEETNINGSADPVTTGGHVDTASQRMISNIGVEDACGAMWQWLRDQSWRLDAPIAHTHAVTVTGAAETVTTTESGTTGIPAWGYQNLAGAKGSLYRQGTYGDVKLLAGGNWNDGTSAGSRSRAADDYRWSTNTNVGARGRAAPQ